jgi:carboxyl-terminal processing protease
MRPTRLALVLSALFLVTPSHADDSISAKIAAASSKVDAAFEQMTDARNAANALAKVEPVARNAITAGNNYLRIAAELESAGMDGLIAQSTLLQSNNHNMRFEAAMRFGMAGDKAAAIRAIEGMYPNYVEDFSFLRDRPAFAQWKDDPEFLAAIKRGQWVGAMGRKSPIGSSYKDKLSDAEKVAGLSLFWSEARRSFAHFANVPDLNWDQVYLDTLPQVLATKTTREYYAVMMQLAPKLKDGHTNIFPPEALRDTFYARPAIRTSLVEGKVLVTRVANTSLQSRLAIGDEVVAIDDMPVHDYARTKIAPFASSSTEQDRQLRMYSNQLFTGDKAKPVKLTLRNAAGKERTEILQRGQEQDVSRKSFDFRMLAGDIAYISLDHFESEDGVKAFEAALPAIMKAKGLIIDVRENGGGDTGYGLEVLSYLAKGPIAKARSLERNESPYQRARWDFMRLSPLQSSPSHPYESEHAAYFSGPVAVLAGPKTFSAAEDFLMSFDTMKRGTIVGSATGGSTGQPMFFNLPGGGSGRICVKNDSYPDGKRFVGVGILPQVAVAPTVADVRAGRDTVLERALEVIAKK